MKTFTQMKRIVLKNHRAVLTVARFMGLSTQAVAVGIVLTKRRLDRPI